MYIFHCDIYQAKTIKQNYFKVQVTMMSAEYHNPTEKKICWQTAMLVSTSMSIFHEFCKYESAS